jgi:hypothetical protein
VKHVSGRLQEKLQRKVRWGYGVQPEGVNPRSRNRTPRIKKDTFKRERAVAARLQEPRFREARCNSKASESQASEEARCSSKASRTKVPRSTLQQPGLRRNAAKGPIGSRSPARGDQPEEQKRRTPRPKRTLSRTNSEFEFWAGFPAGFVYWGRERHQGTQLDGRNQLPNEKAFVEDSFYSLALDVIAK